MRWNWSGWPSKVSQPFEEGFGCGSLLLRLAGDLEGLDQVKVRRGGTFAHHDEFRLLRGHNETAVVFEFAAQGSPPTFESSRGRFGKNAVGEDGREVVGERIDGETGLKVGDHAMNKLDRIMQSRFLHGGVVGEALGFDVRFRDGGEGRRGEGHLHGLFASAQKFELDLPDKKVGAGHPGAAPAFMQGKSPGGELVQYFRLLFAQFSFVDRGQ
jgi:hypothetical protein